MVLCVAFNFCAVRLSRSSHERDQGLSLMVEVPDCLSVTANGWVLLDGEARWWIWRLEDGWMVEPGRWETVETVEVMEWRQGRWAVDGRRWTVEVEVIEGERC